MRISRLVAGTVAAGLLGLTPVAISAPAQATDNLTATVTLETYNVQQPLDYGYGIRLSGAVVGSDGASVNDGTVTLYSMTPSSPTWTPVETVDASGYLSFSEIKATGNVSFKAVYSGWTATTTYEDNVTPAESAPLGMAVTRKVIFKNPRGTLITGKVTPDYKRKAIKVYKKIGKKYKKFKTFKTDGAGRFRFTLPAPRTGTFKWRIVVPGNADFATWETFGTTG